MRFTLLKVGKPKNTSKNLYPKGLSMRRKMKEKKRILKISSEKKSFQEENRNIYPSLDLRVLQNLKH
jgi:hypothetical protein